MVEIAGAVGGAAMTAVGQFTDLFKPEKAKLVAYQVKLLEKAAVPDKKVGELECMFNPTKYTYSESVGVSEKEGQGPAGPFMQFTGAKSPSLKMDLFFDAFADAKGDVGPTVAKLFEWMKADTSFAVEKQMSTPPFVRFEWKYSKPPLSDFYGYIRSCSVVYELFRKDGTPVRATASIEIVGRTDRPAGTNPTSHAEGVHRAHTLVEGESLHSVAYRELGSAAAWRAIAALNDIDDPLRVRPGTRILIPDSAEAPAG